MTFSQFCDAAENTEQEQQLFQMLKKDELKVFRDMMAKMRRMPITGKIFAALLALCACDSIAAFRQSEHYQHIKDYNFKVDFDRNSLYLNPSDAQKKQMAKALAVIGATAAILLICKKMCCRKSN